MSFSTHRLWRFANHHESRKTYSKWTPANKQKLCFYHSNRWKFHPICQQQVNGLVVIYFSNNWITRYLRLMDQRVRYQLLLWAFQLKCMTLHPWWTWNGMDTKWSWQYLAEISIRKSVSSMLKWIVLVERNISAFSEGHQRLEPMHCRSWIFTGNAGQVAGIPSSFLPGLPISMVFKIIETNRILVKLGAMAIPCGSLFGKAEAFGSLTSIRFRRKSQVSHRHLRSRLHINLGMSRTKAHLPCRASIQRISPKRLFRKARAPVSQEIFFASA